MRNFILGVGVLACLSVLPATAGSAPVAPAKPPVTMVILDHGVSRAELTKLLTQHGMTVQDATQNEKDPWLRAKSPKGTEFAVNMYDCDAGTGADNRRCSNLQFLTQWELSKHATGDAASLYNQKFVFGRAYLSKDGKTFMFDYSVNIKDGVTVANLKRHIDNWLRVLDDVRSMLKA